jgi:hypothetical protein
MNNKLKEIGYHLLSRLRGAFSLFKSTSYPVHRDESVKPFFIVGSGRCGTTLLRRLLQASPEIHIPPENWTVGASIAVFRAYSWSLTWGSMVDLILGKHILVNHRWFEGIPSRLRTHLLDIPPNQQSLARLLSEIYRFHGRALNADFNRWGDKTPLNVNHMDEILSVFPHAVFIHLIRDGIDVAYSWSKLDKYGGDLHEPARRWRNAIASCEKFKDSHPRRIVDISYEQMCRDPETALKKICDFINVEYKKKMLYRSDHHNEMQESHSISHYEKVFKPISTQSIGKGRRALSNGEKCSIAPIVDPMLVRLGYDRATS